MFYHFEVYDDISLFVTSQSTAGLLSLRYC